MSPLQNNDSYIGQILIKDGVITEDELQKGLAEQRTNRDYLCANLVRLGLASEERIFSILSLQIGVPYVSLKDIKPDPSVVNCISGKLALACRCFPLRVVGDVFYLAMADPLNSETVNEVKSYLAVNKMKVFLSGDNELRQAINKYYGL